MTTPTETQSTDIPIATVNKIGPSEIASLIVIVGGLLTTYFGHDWGLAKNAQAFGLLAAALASIGTSIARAIKHNGAQQANALVQAARPGRHVSP